MSHQDTTQVGQSSKVLVVHNAHDKSLFSVEPSVSEEILLENNNITVSCKQICPQALHFYQKLQEKRMNFRPASFQNSISILGLQPRDKAVILVCWRSLQWNVFSKNLHEYGVQCPEERNAFLLNPNTPLIQYSSEISDQRTHKTHARFLH